MLTDCWSSFVELSADDNPTDDINGVSLRQRVDKKKKDWSHPEGATFFGRERQSEIKERW